MNRNDEAKSSAFSFGGFGADACGRFAASNPANPTLKLLRRQELFHGAVVSFEFLLSENGVNLTMTRRAQQHRFPSLPAFGDDVVFIHLPTIVLMFANRTGAEFRKFHNRNRFFGE